MDKYGLLGEKLGHSFSPLIHALLGGYDYRLIEKAPDEIGEFLKCGDFAGINVTIPYKKAVIPYCSALSERALAIGSVNTLLRRSDGSLFGDNTDCCGFRYMLEALGTHVRGKKALVLGSGGASQTVRYVLTEDGADSVTVISRSGEENYSNLDRHKDAQLIVNTTPVGMYPNNGLSAVELSRFPSCEAVFDLIYNPSRTKLLLDAEDLGISCINGLTMLVAQAKAAAELFLGRNIENSVIPGITEKISRNTKNVVLIGMPGSGKTSVGRALAEMTGREFFDTDALIEERAGKNIMDIFSEDGEESFRRLETKVLDEASKSCGCIIAAGGGIVKTADNLRLIRQNSVAVFLDRPVDELPSDGRPLSLLLGNSVLAEERMPLYKKWSNLTVEAHGIKQAAEKIREALKI